MVDVYCIHTTLPADIFTECQVLTQDFLIVGSIGQWIKICLHRPKAEIYLQQNMTEITCFKVKPPI